MQKMPFLKDRLKTHVTFPLTLSQPSTEMQPLAIVAIYVQNAIELSGPHLNSHSK